MRVCFERFQHVFPPHLLEKEFRRERISEKAENALGLKFKHPISSLQWVLHLFQGNRASQWTPACI